MGVFNFLVAKASRTAVAQSAVCARSFQSWYIFYIHMMTNMSPQSDFSVPIFCFTDSLPAVLGHLDGVVVSACILTVFMISHGEGLLSHESRVSVSPGSGLQSTARSSRRYQFFKYFRDDQKY